MDIKQIIAEALINILYCFTFFYLLNIIRKRKITDNVDIKIEDPITFFKNTTFILYMIFTLFLISFILTNTILVLTNQTKMYFIACGVSCSIFLLLTEYSLYIIQQKFLKRSKTITNKIKSFHYYTGIVFVFSAVIDPLLSLFAIVPSILTLITNKTHIISKTIWFLFTIVLLFLIETS